MDAPVALPLHAKFDFQNIGHSGRRQTPLVASLLAIPLTWQPYSQPGGAHATTAVSVCTAFFAGLWGRSHANAHCIASHSASFLWFGACIPQSTLAYPFPRHPRFVVAGLSVSRIFTPVLASPLLVMATNPASTGSTSPTRVRPACCASALPLKVLIPCWCRSALRVACLSP